MRVDDFQEPLEVWFMTFIDPNKVHVLSKPRSKLNHNNREQFIFKTIKRRELITQNKIGHESRLIQFFTHEHEKILLSLIAIHE